MAHDLLEARVSFCFPTLSCSCYLLLFYTSHLHLHYLLRDWIDPKVIFYLFFNIVHYFHQCRNLNTKHVSSKSVLIFNLDTIISHFLEGVRHQPIKGWLVIKIVFHWIFGNLNRVALLKILQWHPIWKPFSYLSE